MCLFWTRPVLTVATDVESPCHYNNVQNVLFAQRALRTFHTIQVALSKYEQHDQLKAEASGPLRWPKLEPCGGTFAPFPTQKVDLTEDAHCMILDLSSLSEEEWKP